MHKPASLPPPPDRAQRSRALDAARSVIVQAPAGSGKTDLLTRRFLLLLGAVDDPAQIVAITFTRAAAAEMRHRIVSELEKAAQATQAAETDDPTEMAVLARRALARSRERGWNLVDLPAQLRISTIDAFCRELALQQPLLSGLGGGLEPSEQSVELYRRAARRTLEAIGDARTADLDAALQAVLLWRDNGWQEMEDLLVQMLAQRDRWMHGFVLAREQDWEALRERLERPFAEAVEAVLTELSGLLDQVPGAREEVLALARFACEEPGANSPWSLAECTEIPAAPFSEGLESAGEVFQTLVNFLQTKEGTWRSQKGLTKTQGFPATPRGRDGKARLASLAAQLDAVPGLRTALADVPKLPPLRYSEDDWRILRACFTLLSRAAVELKVVFAESGRVDFTEVAQIAQNVLLADDGLPSDAAMAAADGIRHLLVDEFQDTSRRQHQLLARLIAAWPEREERTCFVVGDPMQSIYFFRDADAELFPRVQELGLEIPLNEPLPLEPVPLEANFRTDPALVTRLNEVFARVFAERDGSGVTFSEALPQRPARADDAGERFVPHFLFVPYVPHGSSRQVQERKEGIKAQREAARTEQTAEIVALIQSHAERMEQARASGTKYRIAVLGRARNALRPVAKALREAGVPFRAVDLEPLKDRPEILDVLALARALLNPQDRVAWLGVLRAPWCGLTLDDLYRASGGDHAELRRRPMPELLAERLPQLSEAGRMAAARVLRVVEVAPRLRFGQPAASPGTWLQQVWLRLGGAGCVDAAARANLDLLWRCLDTLPAGEQDLLGPALDAALEGLNAQPDPVASSEVGVQIMTIHKAKGLEFEVVIVPELQARSGNGDLKLLSWLERGRGPHESQDGEITEFLVAPLQPKGADRGSAKAWVDRVYRKRETQEMRRLLYVAATRAREELHLFARPEYKADEQGALELRNPVNCLLATAWPALEQEAQRQFAVWQAEQAPAQPEILLELAAEAGNAGNLLVMPAPLKATRLLRLPPEFQPEPGQEDAGGEQSVVGPGRDPLYARHEGGLLSRALGRAVHLLLQQLAQGLAAGRDAQATLDGMRARIVAEVRAAGVTQAQAERIAAQASELARRTVSDPVGAWILAPHAEAASEARWTGVIGGVLRTVQVDRLFRAGLTPASDGTAAWWIVDYKTAVAEDAASGVDELRARFAPQIEAYGRVLRQLHGAGVTLRGALYYPRMGVLDWWEMD